MVNSARKDFEMEFKYEFRTLWNPLIFLTTMNFLAVVFLIYSGFRSDIVTGWLVLNIIWTSVNATVFAPRFLRYLKLSKDIVVAIEREERRIVVRALDRERVYSFEDVKSITRWAEDVVGRRRKHKPRWGDFFYYVIYLKSGEEIIITSLMTDEGKLSIGDKESDLNAWDNAQITIKGERIVNLELKKETVNGTF